MISLSPGEGSHPVRTYGSRNSNIFLWVLEALSRLPAKLCHLVDEEGLSRCRHRNLRFEVRENERFKANSEIYDDDQF